MMFAIPWNAQAQLLRADRPATELGTLRGCVRAWTGLNDTARQSSRIVCGEAVFMDTWKIPMKEMSSARIEDLVIRL